MQTLEQITEKISWIAKVRQTPKRATAIAPHVKQVKEYIARLKDFANKTSDGGVHWNVLENVHKLENLLSKAVDPL